MTPIAEWVDLGLPSGTLWRRMNVGAERPTDYGLYYSWGNIDGYPIDSGHPFTAAEYAATPGAALTTDIPPQNDCARFALGPGWRLPDMSEFQELIDCTNHSFELINGVQCIIFRRGASELIIPLGGVINDNSAHLINEQLLLWGTTRGYAVRGYLNDGNIAVIESASLYYGKPVRAIYMPMTSPLTLVVEQCLGSSSSFYGKYIAFGKAGSQRYLIADWKTPSDDPGNEYGCRVFSNLADIDNPESAALPANQIYLTQAGEDAASLAAFISYYNEDNPKPIAGVISGGSAMSLIEGLLISPTAPV